MSSAISIPGVYYVAGVKTERVFNPVGIRPTFDEDRYVTPPTKIFRWEDTGRGTQVIYTSTSPSLEKLQQSIPQKFTVITEDDETIEFVFLTKKVFEDSVAKTVWGNPDFKTDTEVQNYYLNTVFETV